MLLALGLVARLQIRSTHALLNSTQTWHQSLKLMPISKTRTAVLNIWYSPSVMKVVCSNTSDADYGGYMVRRT